MLSFGMLAARAFCTASRRRGFISGSGKPIFAATVISLTSFVKTLERLVSTAPLKCLTLLHLLWPDMFPQRCWSTNYVSRDGLRLLPDHAEILQGRPVMQVQEGYACLSRRRWGRREKW